MVSLKLLFDTREFLLENRRLRLGRSDHLDITIKGDPLISSNHCTITNGVLLDAGSTNGTYLNSQRVVYNKKMQLQHGDVITLGETKLRIVEIKDGETPGADTPPTGSTLAVPPGTALTATMRESKVERRRVGFADDAIFSQPSNGNGTERCGTPNDLNNDELTQTITGHTHDHDTTNDGINTNSNANGNTSNANATGERSITGSHTIDGSSSDDDNLAAALSTTSTVDDKGDGKRSIQHKGKVAMKAPTARVSALAMAIASERHLDDHNSSSISDNNNNTNGNTIGSSNDSGNEDPLSWLPRHGQQSQHQQHQHQHHQHQHHDDGLPRRSPFAISADAFDGLSRGGAPSLIPTGSVSPSPPSELSKDELRVWELERALQKSEAALVHLKKTSSQQQRNRTLVAHKVKMEQLEAKCQALEFQVLYGDTQKDHDIEQLKEALRVASSTPPVPTAVSSDEVARLRAELQHLESEGAARTAELATVREQHQAALDQAARLRIEVEACQRQVQISSAVAAVATAAVAASGDANANAANNNSISSSRTLTDIHTRLQQVDSNVTTLLTRENGTSFNRQQSLMILILVIVMAIINRLL